MKLNKLPLLLVASAAVVAIAVAASSPFSLARVAKAGDEAEYKFNATLDFGGIKIDVSGKNVDKVTKVGEDGSVTYETVQKDLVVKTPDGEQAIEDETKTTMTIGGDRVPLKYENEGDEDASSIRLALLGTVKKPEKAVAVGDKWTATLKHTNKETFPVTAEYEVVAEEKVGSWDTVKIKVSSKETEGDQKASAEGHVWIVIADGTSAKEEMAIKNAPFAMAPAPIDMTIKVERTK